MRAMQGPDVTANYNQQYTTHYSPLARLSMLIKLLIHIGYLRRSVCDERFKFCDYNMVVECASKH